MQLDLLILLVIYQLCFFFQAEDGIRDVAVTGVQTCALPISFWIAFLAARLSGSVFLFGTDANSLATRDSQSWKVTLKKVLWPRLFSLADQIIVPSSRTRELMRSLGFAEDHITLTPYSVDNDW